MAATRWIAPVAWMGVILLLGSPWGGADATGALVQPVLAWLLPQASPEALARAHTAARKLAHVVEYAILGALWLGALRRRSVGAGGRSVSSATSQAVSSATSQAVSSATLGGGDPRATCCSGASGPPPAGAGARHASQAVGPATLRAAALALGVAAAWGGVDETLQARWATRTPSAVDVALDACGGALGVALGAAGWRRATAGLTTAALWLALAGGAAHAAAGVAAGVPPGLSVLTSALAGLWLAVRALRRRASGQACRGARPRTG